MAANGEEAAAPVPLLRFESLCGALRTGLTEAITLKTESDKGAAAFLALQSSAMGLLELKEVRVLLRAPCAPHMDPNHELIVTSSLLPFPSSARRVAACRHPPRCPLLAQVNRSIWEKVAEAKDVCKAKSLDMDVADLRLQNLQYEKNHLVRQIRHCRDFHFDEATVHAAREPCL